MKVGKVLALITVFGIISKPLIAYADEKPEEDYYFSIESIGGKVVEKRNEVSVYSATNVKKLRNYKDDIPLTKLITSKTETIDLLADDDKVLEVCIKEETELKEKEERENRISNASFLNEYNVDVNSLSDKQLDVLIEGYKWVGSWYVWGGSYPPQGTDWTYGNGGGGFDCSGYTRWCLSTVLGIDIGRTTFSQIYSNHFVKIPISEAKAGDIVFNSSVNHTGFFICDNKESIMLMHSPQTGSRIKIGNYSRPKFVYRYVN